DSIDFLPETILVSNFKVSDLSHTHSISYMIIIMAVFLNRDWSRGRKSYQLFHFQHVPSLRELHRVCEITPFSICQLSFVVVRVVEENKWINRKMADVEPSLL